MTKIKILYKQFTSPEAGLFRYSLSYCVLLALLPSILVGILLLQNSIIDINEILALLYEFLPEELIHPFVEYVMDKDFNTTLSVIVAIFASCYVSSKSLYSFMLISARFEKFHTYNIIIRIKSIILFFIMVLGVIAIAFIIKILNLDISIAFGLGLFVIFYLFFRMLSFKKRSITFGISGSVVTSLAMVITGQVFFHIISNFTNYKNVYGPLASVVITLLSIYVVSSVIYLGYCVNFVYLKEVDNDEFKNLYFYKFGENIINRLKKLVKINK